MYYTHNGMVWLASKILGHTQSSVDTMYFSWRPWAGQRSLSADDKLGLCALYPQSADECVDGSTCPDSDACLPHAHGTLCTPAADPMGALCSYERGSRTRYLHRRRRMPGQ